MNSERRITETRHEELNGRSSYSPLPVRNGPFYFTTPLGMFMSDVVKFVACFIPTQNARYLYLLLLLLLLPSPDCNLLTSRIS